LVARGGGFLGLGAARLPAERNCSIMLHFLIQKNSVWTAAGTRGEKGREGKVQNVGFERGYSLRDVETRMHPTEHGGASSGFEIAGAVSLISHEQGSGRAAILGHEWDRTVF
jgi:hypothetical protein